MIGKSDNIGRTHDHAVTNCIHNTQTTIKDKGGGSGNGNNQDTQWQPNIEKQSAISQRSFSIPLITNSIKSIRSKIIGFWNGSSDSGKVPSETLSTLMVKDESKRKDQVEEDEVERKVANVEGAVSGGLRKEQGNIKKFFQNIAETVSKTKILWEKPIEQERQGDSLPINIKEDTAEDNSYLLDSYSKRGEYSTLAKDRSLDSNFKAKG